MFPVPAHLPRAVGEHSARAEPASDPAQPRVSDPTLDLLAPFLDDSAAQAGPSRWTAKRATEIRVSLEHAVKQNKARQHELLFANFATVSSHIQLADVVRVDNGRISSRLTELERDLGLQDPATSFLAPVITHLDRHFSAINRRSRASAHVRSLRALQKQAQRVERLEQAIWAGKGVDGWVVDALRDGVELAGGEGWEEIRGTKAASAIQTRLQLFRSMLLEQVSDAFGQVIRLSPSNTAKSDTVLHVSRQVKLQRPRIPRPEDRDAPSSTILTPEPYALPELYSALSQLGALQSLLQSLAVRIIRDVIRPLLENNSRYRLVSTPDDLTLTPSSPSKQSTTSSGPRTLISDLNLFFDFLDSSIFPPSIDLLERSLFIHQLASPTLDILLEKVLLPSMPSTITHIPDWLALLEDAAGLETTLRPPEVKIRPFLSEQAGEDWIAARRRTANEEVKALVLGGWGGWDAKEVTREKEVTAVVEVEVDEEDPQAPPRLDDGSLDTNKSRGGAFSGMDTPVQAPSTNSPDEEVGGWGFDEEQSGQRTTASTSAAAAVQAVPVEIDQDEGWDFDLDSEPAPSPAAVAISNTTASASQAAKPVREAKKLGKRVAKAKQAEPELEDDPMVDRKDDSPGPQQAPAQVSTGEGDGWGWDEPTESATLPQVPLDQKKRMIMREEKRMVTETYLVSKACDRLLDITERCLSEGQQLASSSSLPAAFTSSSPLLQAAAVDTLDIFRALIFTSQAPQLRDVPTLSMQLSNDFTYLSLRHAELASAYDWDTADLVRRTQAAGEHVFEMQLNVQREGLMSLLDEAEGWEGVGMVTGGKRCERVVSGVEHNLDSLARVLRVVMPTTSFFIVMGYLIDVVVQRISDEVLALQDITEAESEKLNELLGVLHPLEKIFTESDPPTSIVTHVPHWLKYQYLSELLSANLVDIAYLFDTGALVDFTTEELVGIIKALFADSEKRDRAIERIERGREEGTGGGGDSTRS